MKQKVLLSIIIAFIISFSIFTLFQYYYWDTLPTKQSNFYFTNYDESNSKILLIGSSEVGMLNATLIESIIHERHSNIQVFNLASTSDKPSVRLREIPDILSLNPKIIVYGIGIRDFSSNDVVIGPLPDPNLSVSNYISSHTPYFFDNPKLVSLNVIKNVTGYRNEAVKFESNTPFFQYRSDYDNVIDLNELEKKFVPKSQLQILDSNENREFKSLKEIIDKLSENNITTIVFITPHNSFFLDSISQKERKNFDEMIYEIHSNSDVEVYSLMNNFSKMNIWMSENHITHGPEGKIYDEDITNLILRNLER